MKHRGGFADFHLRMFHVKQKKSRRALTLLYIPYYIGHRLSGVLEPRERFAQSGRQPIFQHRLSGVLERDSGSLLPGGSLFSTR